MTAAKGCRRRAHRTVLQKVRRHNAWMQLECLEDRTVPTGISYPVPQILYSLNFPGTAGPVDMTTANVLGHGLQDLLFTVSGNSTSDYSIYTFANQGNGTFQSVSATDLTAAPGAIAAGAFSGTGPVDVAVAEPSTNSVIILTGNNTGYFTPSATLATGSDPSAIVVGDFSGNGILDLAVANAGSNTVSVFMGNGNGTFHSAVNYAVGTDPVALLAGNFGNGQIDLAVADSGSNAVSVLMGNGNGTFQAAVNYSSGGTDPVALTSGVYSGDGYTDLAVANQTSGNVEILRNNGSGSFTLVNGFSMTGVSSLTSVAINGDGLTDIVAGAYLNGTGSTVAVALAQSNGTFGPLTYSNAGAAGITSILASDYGNNGQIEVLAGASTSNTITELQSNGDGTFVEPPQTGIGAGATDPTTIATADFNHDGNPDIVTANSGSGDISVLLGNGAGGFSSTVAYSTGNSDSTPDAVAVGDLTGNGIMDIVTANYGDTATSTSPSYSVFLGNGDGTFRPALTVDLSAAPVAIVLGDFNRDGKLDMALANQNGTISVFLGNGNGTFQSPVNYSAGGTGLSSLAAADLYDNGKLDLVTAIYNNGTGSDLSILKGNGDGTFQAPVLLQTIPAPIYVTAADLNNDGWDELIVAAAGSTNQLEVFLNFDGTFLESGTYALYGLTPRSITVADMNGDGIPDVIVTTETSQSVSIFLGQGDDDASLSGEFTFSVGGSSTTYQSPDPMAAVVGNFSGNGLPDIITADSGGGLSLLLNTSPLTPTTASVTSPTISYGQDGTVTVTVAATSGTPSGNVRLTVDSGTPVVAALVNGSATFNVGTLSVGSHTLSATYVASDGYQSSTATGTLVVNAASQTISFGTLANQTYGVAPFTVSATASSGLAVGFSIVSGPASIVGNTITILGAGTVTVAASQTGNSDYGAAAVVDETFTVNQAPLTVTIDDSSRTYGAANPTFTVGYTGFVNGDTSAALGGTLTLATTVTSASPVGAYAITGSGLTSTNYNITYVNGTLTIAPAALTVSVNDATTVYGAGLPNFSVSYNGFVNGDSSSSLGGTLAYATSATSTSPVGSYTVTASGLTSNNYAISYVGGTLSVTPAALAVTVNNASSVYGSALPTFTASFSGFVNGDTSGSLGGTLNFSTSATAASSVGSYAVSASGLPSNNYTISYANGTLTITPAALSVTVNNASSVYGSALPSFTASYTGFVNGDTSSSLGGTLAFSTAASNSSSVGNYAVTASGLTSNNYSISYVNGTFTITPVPLTVSVNNASSVYGSGLPTFTASYSGFVNGDTSGSLGGTLTFSTTATAASPVGSYAVSASGLTSSNYTIGYDSGTLSITPAPLTVTVHNATSIYGSALPAFTASYSGFINGDSSSSLGGSLAFATTATPASSVGSYGVTASGLTSTNYTVTYDSGTLTITPAALSVTVNNASRTYGAANPSFTAGYSGFVNGDTAASLGGSLTFTTAATPASAVGTYSVTASGLTSNNYTISYVGGTLSITPAALTITVNNASSVYGSALPSFTAGYSGFVNGDTAASLGGTLAYSTTASSASPVGSYAVSASGLTSNNYAITYVNGTLTITPAALTVTANDATRTYGAANPTFTAGYAGFVNGDTAASLGGNLTFSTSATAGSSVGTYGITPGGLTSNNYTITYTNGALTVTPAPLTVTVYNVSSVYGSALPAFTAGYDGLLNGDSASSLGGALAFSTSASATSSVGDYAVTASGLTSGNYAISYVGGTLTITPAALTVSVNNASRVYGSANPAFTASYNGFVNGDTAAALGGALAFSTAATTASSVGSYGVTASGLTSSNYNISYVAGTLSVTPAALTVTVNNASSVYGSTLPTFTASYSGFVNGDTSASLGGALHFSTSATAASSVGSYAVSASGLTSNNYTISYANGTLTITPAALTVTVNNASSVYGSALPSFTASYSGFVNGDTSSTLGGTLAFSTAASTSSSVGNYAITASGLNSNNYSISYVNGTLAITPAPLTVSVNNASSVYGSGLPTFTASYSGFVNGDTASSLGGTLTFSTTATAASPVGSYAVSASGLASTNYTIGYDSGTLSITPAGLTVTVNNATSVYGSALPSFTASYSGFVNGDNASALGGSLAFATAATPASSVGTYGVTASGLSSTNYKITYDSGTLTITPAALSVAVNNASRAYGAANPSFSASYSGFVNGDTAASLGGSLTFTTAATPSSAVGNYTVTASGLTSNKYAISYVGGTLSVTPAALTVTVNNASSVYGSALPSFTAGYSGFENGDTASSLGGALAFSTAATSASSVGSYAVTASGLSSSNYTISYQNGTLTITPAALTVTANNASRVYGAANPAFSASYSGFVNGDTAASLGGTLSFSTAATSATSVGSYAITASGLSSNNYTISYVNGTLTITPAALTVTVNNASRTYGAANPTFSASYAGFVNGDSASSLTGTLTYSTSATAASPVGSYAISASGLTSNNYTISYVNGTLTITPAALTVTANNASRAYGATNPTFAASYSGFVNGDSASSLGGTLTLSTAATSATPVGTYAITGSGLTSTNYTISYVNGTLTVTPAPLAVTVNNASRLYGAANPTFTATYSGFVNGDTSAALGGTLSLSTTATTASPVGSYAITGSGLSSTNYSISYVNGTLTVTPAPLTVTANNASRVYGAANPTFTASYSGFVNGDTSASVGGALTFSTPATTNSTVGTYTLTPSGLTSNNYTISYVGGTLTINKDATTTSATASSTSTAFGQTISLTATISANAPGSGTPTGSVDFYDSTTSTDLGSAPVSNGQATLLTGTLPVGSQAIVVTYSGDSNFLTSSTNLATITVTPSILILDPSAGGALDLSGNAAIKTAGTVWVDSSNGEALIASGNASISAASIHVVGGVSKSGNASFSPTPITGAASMADPLAGLVMPSTTGLTNYGAEVVTGNNSATINPGIYTKINVSGNGHLTMNPGTYIVEGGGFNVSGNASISGSHVTIFNMGSAYPGAGGSYGTINLSGNGSFSVTAPTTGAYAGLVIVQPQANAKALNITGNAVAGLVGTIYAPAAGLQLSGNGTLNDTLIVDMANLSGNTVTNSLSDPAGTTLYTPAQIRQAYGINNLSLDGTGQTIAIVTAYDDPGIYAAVDDFDNQFGLTSSGPTLYQQYGPSTSFLQVLNESGGATALPGTDPNGASLSSWEAEESLDVEWVHAIAPGAKIVLVECNSQSLPDLMQGVATASAQPGVSVVSMSWGFVEGQSVVASDEATYDNAFTAPGVTYVASTGDFGTAAPEYPAFSPNVVAVGGTSLTLNADGSYGSESGWGYQSSTYGEFVGSGGGLSAYEAEPTYQQGVQSTGYRSTPDVAMVADPDTGVWIADPYDVSGTDPFVGVGGTSVGAPVWAGLFALVNQGRAQAGKAALNGTAPTATLQALYTLPQSDYNSIASGTNCAYDAAAGYNLVTGLGTPIAGNLVPNLIAYQGSGAFATTGLVAAINPDLNAVAGYNSTGGSGSGTVASLLATGSGREFSTFSVDTLQTAVTGANAQAASPGLAAATALQRSATSSGSAAANVLEGPARSWRGAADGRFVALQQNAGALAGWLPSAAVDGSVHDAATLTSDEFTLPASPAKLADGVFGAETVPTVSVEGGQAGSPILDGFFAPSDDPLALDDLAALVAPVLGWQLAVSADVERTRNLVR